MTKAQLIIDFKNMIGPAGKGCEVSDSGITVWLNDAYMLCVDKIIEASPDFFTKKSTSSSTAGDGEYTLPDDFEKMVLTKVSYDGVTTVRALPLNNIGQATDLTNSTSNDFNVAQPYYYIFKNIVGFLPEFSDDGTNNIAIWYAYTPTPLVDDTDVPDLPLRMQGTLKYWAYANYLDQNDEHTAAEVMRRRFDVQSDAIANRLASSQNQENKSVEISYENIY